MKFEEEWSFLNPYQMTAVLDESPACVVNANVGSGKTTVLIAKILYLYQVKQIQPEEMIVLTFTNKAADEIKDNWQLDTTFESSISPAKRDSLLMGWRRAVKCAINYTEE